MPVWRPQRSCLGCMDVQVDGAPNGEDDLELIEFDVLQEADTNNQADNADTPRDQFEGMPETSEAHRAKIKQVRKRASSEEIALHDPTHCPYRSWWNEGYVWTLQP